MNCDPYMGQLQPMASIPYPQTWTTAAPALPKEGQLASFANSLDMHSAGLETIAGRLRALADRLVGAQPEAAAKVPNYPPDGCIVQTLSRQQERMQTLLSAITAATERLEAL